MYKFIFICIVRFYYHSVMVSNIINNYYFPESLCSYSLLGNGNINDTYKIEFKDRSDKYVLQKVNASVFKDPFSIADTHSLLLSNIDKIERSESYSLANLIPNIYGKNLTIDGSGDFWRLTSFIEDSYAISSVTNGWQALEAGRAYGWFLKYCSDFDSSNFKEAIKDFHKLSFRIEQFKNAINNNIAGRKESVEDIISFYLSREEQLMQIEILAKSGDIPIRVVHNDTKIDNLLFIHKKAVAVIDLDTVGPGLVFYDYGDALRTGANSTKEDERDLDKVDFNIEYFYEFTNGYLSNTAHILTKYELEYLHISPILMTYIMGIRFLTDYLNGDVYYRIESEDHNLVRTKVQKRLIESIESKQSMLKQIIKSLIQ